VKLVVKIALGVILAVILLIAGCTALLSAGVSEAQSESDKTAITQAEYEAVKKGSSRVEVEAMLGKPSDIQESEIEALGETYSSDCIYYNRDGDLASMYQFCFDNDKLTSKASY
jgi:hypothetical protein